MGIGFVLAEMMLKKTGLDDYHLHHKWEVSIATGMHFVRD